MKDNIHKVLAIGNMQYSRCASGDHRICSYSLMKNLTKTATRTEQFSLQLVIMMSFVIVL